MDQKQVAIDTLEKVWNNQEFHLIDNLIADDMALHSRGKAIRLKTEDLVSIIEKWKETFPDLHYEILHVVSENNIVAINSIMHGTPIKPWKSYQPLGKSMSVPHVFFMKFREGKIVDVWEINDFTVLESQLT